MGMLALAGKDVKCRIRRKGRLVWIFRFALIIFFSFGIDDSGIGSRLYESFIHSL